MFRSSQNHSDRPLGVVKNSNKIGAEECTTYSSSKRPLGSGPVLISITTLFFEMTGTRFLGSVGFAFLSGFAVFFTGTTTFSSVTFTGFAIVTGAAFVIGFDSAVLTIDFFVIAF